MQQALAQLCQFTLIPRGRGASLLWERETGLLWCCTARERLHISSPSPLAVVGKEDLVAEDV